MTNILYIVADILYRWAMMESLPDEDFKYSTTSLDDILSTPDDSDYGYYIVCDNYYIDICKDKTEQLALKTVKGKTNVELGCRQREKGRARTEKLFLDQNTKTEYMVHYSMLKFYAKMG